MLVALTFMHSKNHETFSKRNIAILTLKRPSNLKEAVKHKTYIETFRKSTGLSKQEWLTIFLD